MGREALHGARRTAHRRDRAPVLSGRKERSRLKRLIAALACACVLSLWVFGSTAAAGVEFGANDDTGKYSLDGGAVYFPQMAAAGLKQNVMTVRWKPSDPLNIPDQAALDVAR